MEIKEITNKFQWENFVNVQKANTFLQSWNWGEFNKLTRSKIWRLGIFDSSTRSARSGQASEELIGVALVIKVKAKRGKFLFCPHQIGIMNHESRIMDKKIQNTLFDYLRELAIKEKVDFVRISPLVENTPENLKIFQDYGFRNAPVHMMHPELSWILDISRTEEEIMKGMRKTTRNLVRRAEKDGVEVSEVKNIEGIEEFYRLHEQTVGRHGFTPFSKDYLKKEFEAFAPDDQISIFFAKHGDVILSSAVIAFSGDSAFYHHGASQYSKIPASYLLMWRVIQKAKKRGCAKFNFWGIAPESKLKHPWAGLTIFKTGFGGHKEEYLHCQDLPITLKYWFNWLVETIRRWRRGY